MAEMLFNPGQPADLIVCSQDTKGFLHKVSTVLAFNQLDIVQAHIQTMKDKVFDVCGIDKDNDGKDDRQMSIDACPPVTS